MSRIVCILGMHRSGTSCLAGSLESGGLHLGEVSVTGRHNPKGNRENKRIMALQEAVLVYSGGSWDRPPKQVRWSDSHRAERDAIIRMRADVPVWGFKDPRTILLLDFWQEARSNLDFVGSVRHPRLVAESLCRRSQGSMEAWLDLWLTYNERLLVLNMAQPFPIVRFDLEAERYRCSLAIVLDHLGLQALPQTEFFDPTLRHYDLPSTDSLPENIVRLYEAICRVAVAP